MFEQSLVESSGGLRSKAGRWMGLAAAFNLSVLALLMVKPLLYPEALPQTVLAAMLTAPSPPPAAAPPRAAATPRSTPTRAVFDPLTAPIRIPPRVAAIEDPPPSGTVTGTVLMAGTGSSNLGLAGALGLPTAKPVVIPVQPVPPKMTRVPVSSGVIAGNRLTGSTPLYPTIAKAAHVSGVVVLHAIISRAGTIQSLAVVSGPEMLRSSAVAAVQDWRYRPYLLNGEPAEVDTTITVNFSFGS